MNFCSNPHSLQTIPLNELVGKSLNTINTNFSLLRNQICTENNFLTNFASQYTSLFTKVQSLSTEFKKIPLAFVYFEQSGNILKQKNITSVNKISTGKYQILFSFTFPNTFYITIPSIFSSTSTMFTSIENENTSFVTITIREQNGSLVDPEKISLTFFA